MLTSKFDLYKTEWLDLVFENRNKNYGAYYLRQHYAGNMVKAMGITFFGVAALFGASIVFNTKQLRVMLPPQARSVIVNLTPISPPVNPPKKVDPPKSSAPVKTIQNLPPVVMPDGQAKTPPIENAKITGAIGQTTTTGTVTDPGIIETNTGTGTQPVVDESIHILPGLDVMPEPAGGESAWAKFLNKNLRFPLPAQDAGVSGKVILSFVIEKDGHLSNIVVERGAGYGFDEEAMRVLKLAKAWKPGMQNGQPVRVRYAIPINFQLSSE
ncbi:MAG: Gram-negative bacterial tonB protein [Mucilaginibacter sp.]|nr:Gram-negative bacterial tonB protein [Mucilaginibacter sp.]